MEHEHGGRICLGICATSGTGGGGGEVLCVAEAYALCCIGRSGAT